MECSAYNSIEENISTWLISPQIDLSNTTNKILVKTKAGYYNGGALKVYISEDYDRNTNNINNANWILLNTNIANQPLMDTEKHLLIRAQSSCLSKKASIGFHYTGSILVTTTFQIEDVLIKGN